MLSRIKQARERIEALRLAMLSPALEEVVAALPGLEEAARCLQHVEREVREGMCAPYEVRRELKLLKNDLRISARLVEHGLSFCQGWAQLLGSGPAYTPQGQSVPLAPEGAISLQG